jgi:C_GCAxxG_C_C family probable redox protein
MFSFCKNFVSIEDHSKLQVQDEPVVFKLLKGEDMMGHQEKLLEEIFELALLNDMNYFGWTQAVLAALQEKLNIGSAEVFKAGSALAGGVARQGETCGALTGAVMAIGSVVGRERLEDIEQYRKAMEPASRMYREFKERIGHTLCHEIHKIRYGRVYHLCVPEEGKAFHEMGGHSRKGCPEVCGIAAKMAADIIFEIGEKP